MQNVKSPQTSFSIIHAPKDQKIIAFGNGFLPQEAVWDPTFSEWRSLTWKSHVPFKPCYFAFMPQESLLTIAWTELVSELELGWRHSEAFQNLFESYSHPERLYHNLKHIEQGLPELAKQSPEVRMAWFFHDRIYNPLAKDNEEQSVFAFHFWASRMNINHYLRNEVERLILLTKNHDLDCDDLKGVAICQADLSILASKSKKRYEEYAENLRKEYMRAGITYQQWKKGRTEFLENLLTRSQIFPGPYNSEIEQQIKLNLNKELHNLRQLTVIM